MSPSCKIISTHEIEYSNGFKQVWHLTSKDNYVNILKPLLNLIEIEKDSNKGNDTELSLLLKKAIRIMFIDKDKCFHEGSPFHLSMSDGILRLHVNQGGEHKVKWTLLKKYENGL